MLWTTDLKPIYEIVPDGGSVALERSIASETPRESARSEAVVAGKSNTMC